MADIKFIRVSSGNISTITPVDGQFIVTKDTGELHTDIGTIRHKISDIIPVTIASNPVGLPNKLYINTDTTDNAIYKWNGSTYIKAQNILGTEVAFSGSGIAATNVQAAINEVKTGINESMRLYSSRRRMSASSGSSSPSSDLGGLGSSERDLISNRVLAIWVNSLAESISSSARLPMDARYCSVISLINISRISTRARLTR